MTILILVLLLPVSAYIGFRYALYCLKLSILATKSDNCEVYSISIAGKVKEIAIAKIKDLMPCKRNHTDK